MYETPDDQFPGQAELPLAEGTKAEELQKLREELVDLCESNQRLVDSIGERGRQVSATRLLATRLDALINFLFGNSPDSLSRLSYEVYCEKVLAELFTRALAEAVNSSAPAGPASPASPASPAKSPSGLYLPTPT